MDIEVPNKQELTEEQILKRKKFEQHIEQQNKLRDEFKQKKLEKRQKEKDPEELMLNIQKEFRAKYEVIRQSIEKKEITASAHINQALDLYQELLNYYIMKNYALTSYDKQKYKEQLDQLECTLYTLRGQIIPRQSFKFSKNFPKFIAEQGKLQKQQQQGPTISDQRVISPESTNTEELINTQFNGGSLVIRHITDRKISIQGFLDTLYLQNLTNIEIFDLDIRGSVWVDKCSECSFFGKMHQLRIHETHETQFIVHVTSKPIIERCTSLQFGKIEPKDNEFLQGINYWNEVQDFNWLKQEKSPNFTLIE